VVVHDAARDQYQMPLALSEAGELERFVTDWYTPLGRPFWRALATSRIGSSLFGIRGRYCHGIPQDRISDQKLRFLFGLLRRKVLRRPFQDEIAGASAGRLAAKIANRLHAPVLAASYSGSAAFANLRPGIKKVLFQVHPHPRSLQRLYRRFMAMGPEYSGLSFEPEADASEVHLREWERESADADFVLCASQFTRRSLEESGIERDRIALVTYGVDSDLFQFGRPQEGAPFTALFVGQRNARKGLPMLLRTWNELRPTDARLVVAGGHVRDDIGLEEFAGTYEEVPRTGLSQLIALFQSADVFVLPSLAEGFGHVYLEALSCGTPVICTENTGGADIIREGESGWVLPAGDGAALRDRLAWCADHREQVKSMRGAARAVAEAHTWERFRERLRDVLSSVTGERAVSRPTHELPSLAAGVR
jgi:glycosyltransferase involved in cell wall biosynthesis